ncbi:MAG TPA: tetratricopeptide repeat protein [Thermoplasmata archaeon]|nr:tetratricopeptide repeat protein [Thermoplasmata archaeon]
MPGVTVGERILVHLSGFLRHADAYECPVDMTQDGIAASLSISRAHVALELKRLKTTGKVAERMAHVANARSRRKVYDLTPAGQEVARRMREHAKGRAVTLLGPEGRREVAGHEAIDALRRAGLRESEAVQRILAADVVEILRPAAKPSPAPGRAFFGRAMEITALRDWLASDTRPVAIVIGVAGIGKSALLATLVGSEARPTCVRRVYAHDDAHGLLSSFADFLARQGRRRLRAVLVRPAYDPTEAIAVLREDLAGYVVVVDDLHASPAADALLKSLLERPPAAKILVASRTQPSFYERPDLLRGAILEMRLEGLDEPAATELLAAKGASLPHDALERVIAATRGHPLALELFAASGLDAGAVETERYILETVLEELDDASEAILRTFAILRRPARSPEALGATVAQIRRLVRRALLHHREDGYQLHDLVKEFFVRRMAPSARREAHARAAAYWSARDDGLEEAFHRIETGDAEGAAARLVEVGPGYAESARAGDLEACLLRVPRDARLDGVLAETEMFLGKFDDAKRVLEGIATSGPAPARLRARIQIGRIANRLGTYSEARTILEETVKDARTVGVRDLQGEALRALGGVERKLGDLPSALQHLAEAAELLENGSREKVRALTDLGAALIARGDMAGARARLTEAAAMARRGTREEATIHINLGIVQSREGDARSAATSFERSAEVAMRTGDVRFASYALANAVDNLLQLEETEAAAAKAEQALHLASTIGDPVAVSTARANLGLVFAKRGEWTKAEAHLLESVEMIARLDNPYSLATRYEELARLYEAQGRTGDAAPWRARADSLFARLRDGSGAARP